MGVLKTGLGLTALGVAAAHTYTIVKGLAQGTPVVDAQGKPTQVAYSFIGAPIMGGVAYWALKGKGGALAGLGSHWTELSGDEQKLLAHLPGKVRSASSAYDTLEAKGLANAQGELTGRGVRLLDRARRDGYIKRSGPGRHKLAGRG